MPDVADPLQVEPGRRVRDALQATAVTGPAQRGSRPVNSPSKLPNRPQRTPVGGRRASTDASAARAAGDHARGPPTRAACRQGRGRRTGRGSLPRGAGVGPRRTAVRSTSSGGPRGLIVRPTDTRSAPQTRRSRAVAAAAPGRASPSRRSGGRWRPGGSRCARLGWRPIPSPSGGVPTTRLSSGTRAGEQPEGGRDPEPAGQDEQPPEPPRPATDAVGPHGDSQSCDARERRRAPRRARPREGASAGIASARSRAGPPGRRRAACGGPGWPRGRRA